MLPSSTLRSLDGSVAGSAVRKRAMLLKPTARRMRLSKLSLVNKTPFTTIQRRKDGSTRRTPMELSQPPQHHHHPKVRLQERLVQLSLRDRVVLHLHQCLHFPQRVLLCLLVLLGRRVRIRRHPILHLSIRHEVRRRPLTLQPLQRGHQSMRACHRCSRLQVRRQDRPRHHHQDQQRE